MSIENHREWITYAWAAGAVGVYLWLVRSFLLVDRSFSGMIRKVRAAEEDSIDELSARAFGSKAEVHAVPADVQVFEAPMTLRPCAWWSCQVTITEATGDEESVNVQTRLLSFTTSGNDRIYLKGTRDVLPVRLNNAQMVPETSFCWTAGLNEDTPASLKHFIDHHLSKDPFYLKQGHGIYEVAMAYEGLPLTIIYKEEIIPLEGKVFAFGELVPLSLGTEAATVEERLSGFGSLLDRELGGSDVIVCAGSEDDLVCALEKKKRFYQGVSLISFVAILVGIVALTWLLIVNWPS